MLKTLTLILALAISGAYADDAIEASIAENIDIIKLREDISLLEQQLVRSQIERAELETQLVELNIAIQALIDRVESLSGVQLQTSE